MKRIVYVAQKGLLAPDRPEHHQLLAPIQTGADCLLSPLSFALACVCVRVRLCVFDVVRVCSRVCMLV